MRPYRRIINAICIINATILITDSHHFHAQHFYNELMSIRANIAESLNSSRRFGQIYIQNFGRFAQGVDAAQRRRWRAPCGTAQCQWFTRDNTGFAPAHQCFILINHPRHNLGVGIDIWSRNILIYADMAGNVTHVAATEPFQFILGHITRVTNDATFCAAERNISNGRFPCHPCGQRTHSINRLIRMETNAAFCRATRIIILHTEALKDFPRAIIHLNRNGEMKFTHWHAQKFTHGWV